MTTHDVTSPSWWLFSLVTYLAFCLSSFNEDKGNTGLNVTKRFKSLNTEPQVPGRELG